MAGENGLRGISLGLCGREQEVLGGNVLVFKIGSFLKSPVNELSERGRHGGLGRALSRDFGQVVDLAVRLVQNDLRTNAQLLENRRNDAFLILKQGSKQVQGQQLRVAMFGRDVVGALNRFLRFNREFVPANSHGENLIW